MACSPQPLQGSHVSDDLQKRAGITKSSVMKYAQIIETVKTRCTCFTTWLLRAEHRQKAQELKEQARKAFTEHPEETGESYLEHLWFTTKMSLRFIYTTVVLIIHGVFPFLLTRAASSQIEVVYRIMKSRIPQSRREVIDADPDYFL